MKRLITALFVMTSIFLSAQPTLTITSVQVHPSPTYSSSNTIILSKIAMNRAWSEIIMSVSMMSYSIDVTICYKTSTTTAQINRTDTIPLEQLPAGQYTVSIQYLMATNETNCEPVNSTTYIFDVIAGVGIDERLLSGFLVYPNPFTDRLVFVNNLTQDLEYRIVSSTGAVTEWREAVSQELQLPNLANGLYILEIKNATAIIRKKILKTD